MTNSHPRIHFATAEVLPFLTPTKPSSTFLTPHPRLSMGTDIVALVIQAIGLALTFPQAQAAGLWGLTLPAQAHTGQTILFIGLLVHTLSIATSLTLFAIAFVRMGQQQHHYAVPVDSHKNEAPALSPKSRTFIIALLLATGAVLARTVYRTAASWGGLFSTPLARDQVGWLVAEGVLLTEAMVSMAIFHPSLWLEAQQPQHHAVDVEGGLTLGVGRPNGKRISSGSTILSSLSSPQLEHHDDDMAARMMHHDLNRQHLGQDDDIAEVRQLLFSSHIIPPPMSEAGSSQNSGSRRGSRVLPENPYYHFEETEEDAPYDPALPTITRRDASPYSEEEGRFSYHSRNPSGNVLAESRGLSPLEAEAEQERRQVDDGFVVLSPPRKSSRRKSLLSPPPPPLMLEQDLGQMSSDSDGFVEPPRKSSKRKSLVMPERLEAIALDDVGPPRRSSKRLSMPTRTASFEAGDDSLGTVEPPRRSSKRKSLPARQGTIRGEQDDDDDFDVQSIVLPPRMASKREDDPKGDLARKDTTGTLDSISLYSQ